VGMTTWLDADVAASYHDPSVRPFNGSIKTPGNRPDMGANTIPFIGQDYGIGVAMSDDVMNRLLYELYRTGMLHLDADDALNACDPVFYLLLPQICDEYGTGMGDNVPLDVKIRPQLPPVFRFSQTKSGTLETEIQLGDMFIYLYADGAGGPEPVLTIAVSSKIPVDITHDWGTNSLNLEFGDVLAVADTINNPLDMPENLFEGFAPLVVELLLPILNEFLGGVVLPSFEIGGDEYLIQVAHILYIGSNLDFMGIYGAIAPATP